MKTSLGSFLRSRALRVLATREPDFIIGGRDDPYMLRWYITPYSGLYRDIKPADRTPWQHLVRSLPNLYLHLFLRSDDDRALHDHPWIFNCSWLLDGPYTEHTIAAGGVPSATVRLPGEWKFRWGAAPHRIELHAGPCVTLFLSGPTVREWGFHCPKGWVPWHRFTDARDSGSVGRGCDS